MMISLTVLRLRYSSITSWCKVLTRNISAMDYHSFNSKRCRLIAGSDEACSQSNGIAYYMHRDQRVQDNWAFIYSQDLALKHNLPLYVLAGLNVKHPDSAEATRRAIDFTLGGLQEVASECSQLGIEFHFLQDHHVPMYTRILKFMQETSIKCIVADFSPLHPHRNQIKELGDRIDKESCLFQVDAHNIVPAWEASNKDEPRAMEMRQKIMPRFNEFFTEFPVIKSHPIKALNASPIINWDQIRSSVSVDESVPSCEWAQPGSRYGLQRLQKFVAEGLKIYNEKRNIPTVDAISNLSPWFHSGHVSAQRAVIAVKKYEELYPKSVFKFVDEAVVWSEMSDNYCLHNKNYDNLNGAPKWAIDSLNQHRGDKREYLYSREQFEKAQTHDDLWNAAQIQLNVEGKMHGFMRMYWSKKILEWSTSPDEAIAIALYLNDHYSLDGADSNGFAGVMWSIAGVHDPPKWGERPVYGRIRYMSYKGCKGKFDIFEYIKKYKSEGSPSKPQGGLHNYYPKSQPQGRKQGPGRVQGSWGGVNSNNNQ